jgi:2-keto-4-pentenoate hydratase/2-oxohepta-3-ene-1,7-dioic acid hydratase in catechol pathway
MKALRFNGGRIGLAEDTDVIDVTDLVDNDPAYAWPPTGMLRLIRDFAALSRRALQSNRPRLPFASVRLDAPIVWPNKLLALPVNYTAHGTEMKSANRADLNGFFLKTASSISGPNDPVILPDLQGREIHHECELGIVIGREGRNIPRERAYDYIFGYMNLIDVVVRGKEERVMRKSYDTFCPIGPWIVTADEIADPQNLDMHLWINGEIRQQANTKDMIVDIPGMIEMISRVSTLQPGDVIATGTPAGVGPIVAGDTMRIAIDGLSEMTLAVQ